MPFTSTWADSDKQCKSISKNATLVSIDSAFENQDVTNQSTYYASFISFLVFDILYDDSLYSNSGFDCDYAFIGYHKDSKNVWLWVDGDKSSYVNWRRGKYIKCI